jgi:tetratricopeptide (TPR) repeat protein
MFELKPLSEDSIPKALVKAKHYRLLNEPWQASSICRDILAVDPDNQKAIMYLILAISDQFDTGKTRGALEARDLCKQLKKKYEQLYYRGIIQERSGRAALKRKTPRAKYIAYEHYRKAMDFFEEADKIHPDKNEDAILRWNACARRIQEHKLEAAPDDNRVLF